MSETSSAVLSVVVADFCHSTFEVLTALSLITFFLYIAYAPQAESPATVAVEESFVVPISVKAGKRELSC